MKNLFACVLGLILGLFLPGCMGKYVDRDGTVYEGISDAAAYNMAVRDASVENAKTYAESMVKMKDNPGGQVGVSMAHATNKPAFKPPETWVDQFMKLYPMVRDGLFLGLGYGNGDRRNSSDVETTLSDVKAGRDIYINSDKADAIIIGAGDIGSQDGGSFPRDSGNVVNDIPTDNSTDNSTTDNSTTTPAP